jgi:hypothetical protein
MTAGDTRSPQQVIGRWFDNEEKIAMALPNLQIT